MNQTPKNRWSNLRESFAAIRELIIVMAMLGILFMPTRVRNVLDAAGIRSVAGLEFDVSTLAESEAAVEQAEIKVAELERELTNLQGELTKLASSGGNGIHPKWNSVSRLLAEMQATTAATGDNLRQSRSKQADLLRQHGYSAQIQPAKASESDQALLPPAELFSR